MRSFLAYDWGLEVQRRRRMVVDTIRYQSSSCENDAAQWAPTEVTRPIDGSYTVLSYGGWGYQNPLVKAGPASRRWCGACAPLALICAIRISGRADFGVRGGRF